ncbi:MAG: DUF2085 domain-containing protein [Anaerolineae bacterium]|nr:DUF2085 domain-containing protein [Anaerolineae bacterium]
MTTTRVTGRTSGLVIGIDKLILTFGRHWLLVVNVMAGLFIGLTVAAPLLMVLGLEGPAWVLYRFYALNCHQLPQRSYFLFGPDGVDTYPLEQILAWGGDPGYLRGFVGNAEVGFKMAMAHRNTAIYTAVFLAGLAYALLRDRLRALPWKWYLILIAPMFFDGVSHVVSEVAGLGFRDTNAWATWLTGGVFGPAFYAGAGIGSLNWLLRTLTGALFGLASVWLAYPLLEAGLADIRQQLEGKLARVGVWSGEAKAHSAQCTMDGGQ